MNQLEIDFIYHGKKIAILCSKKELMKDIINRYSNKSKIVLNSIYFLYAGDKINENSSLEKIIQKEDKNKKKIEILVCSKEEENQEENKSKIRPTQVICPECGEVALLDLKNYKLIISCKNNHKLDKMLLEDFDKTQIIDESKIICEKCRTTNKSISFNKVFYICLICKQKLCPLCKTSHDKIYNRTHYTIKYEEKDSICFEHKENYNLYCKTCNKNLCASCENDHIQHETITLGRLIPKEKNLNKKLNDLKDSIDKFKEEIKKIINVLNKVKGNMDKYYKISKDIINSFNVRIKNYEMLANINEINKFDDIIMKDIDKIIKEKRVFFKFIYIFNIYCKMNSEEYYIIKKEIFEKNNMELNNITYINYLYFKKIFPSTFLTGLADKIMNNMKTINMDIINMNNMMNNNMMNNNMMNNNMMNNNIMNNNIINNNMMNNNMMNNNMMSNNMMNNNIINNNMMNNNMMNNNMMNNNMMNNNTMSNININNNMMSNINMNNNMMSNINMNNIISMHANESRIIKEYSILKSTKLSVIDFIDFLKNLKEENIAFYDFIYPELENIKDIDLGFNGINLSKNNFFEWEFTLKGPKYSPYSGGLFHLKAFLPKDYPDSPPEICFITPIYHLEVNPKYHSNDGEKLGHISTPILELWDRKTTMKEVILSIFPFFYSQINPESPYGLDRADEFFNDNWLFEKKIKFFTQKYANPSLPYKEYNNSWDFSYTE